MGRSEVVIYRDIITHNVDIYVFSGNHVGVYELGEMEWVEHEAGTMPQQPTLRIDEGIWSMILAEAFGKEPTFDELADTRKVRDRLLKMVEDEWAAKVETGT